MFVNKKLVLVGQRICIVKKKQNRYFFFVKKYSRISKDVQILYAFANDVQEFIGHPQYVRHQYCNPRLLHSVIARILHGPATSQQQDDWSELPDFQCVY